MSESHIDCNTCIHFRVCKYFQNIVALSPIIKETSFKCKEFIDINERSLFFTPKKDLHPELTVDELSKLFQEKNKEKEVKDSEINICSLCHKESNDIVLCASCGRPCCEDCREETYRINPDTEKYQLSIICKECSIKEDGE